jgi:hypothetical protein
MSEYVVDDGRPKANEPEMTFNPPNIEDYKYLWLSKQIDKKKDLKILMEESADVQADLQKAVVKYLELKDQEQVARSAQKDLEETLRERISKKQELQFSQSSYNHETMSIPHHSKIFSRPNQNPRTKAGSSLRLTAPLRRREKQRTLQRLSR